MGLSGFKGIYPRQNALACFNKQKHMMGPSKACVADTPRLATVRTTDVNAFERARSRRTPTALPIHGTPHTVQQHLSMAQASAAARWRPPAHVAGGLVSAPLTHAPLPLRHMRHHKRASAAAQAIPYPVPSR